MPCAGQRSVTFFPFCFSKMNPFDSVENVGGLVPTGSIENAILTNIRKTFPFFSNGDKTR